MRGIVGDSERREVARRLRENAEAHPKMSLILNLAFADDSLKPDGAMEWKVTSHDAAMRLADLIEPTCDRDALLALADEMDAHWLGHEGMEDSPVARWSRELREALGEAE